MRLRSHQLGRLRPCRAGPIELLRLTLQSGGAAGRADVKVTAGKPFRVLCDFTQTITMPAEVCAVFVRGQELAHGMERDAFVCSSSVLRLQLVRIARESGRIGSLGPLRFVDSVDAGRAYLMR
jgi:hypothetical protein